MSSSLTCAKKPIPVPFRSSDFLRWGFFALAIVLFGCAGAARAQSDTDSEPDQTGVVLTKLRLPVYPRIARTAHITGDVELRLQIGRNGSVQSVEYIGGPPLLQRTAMESARQSEFDCRKCTEDVTTYHLIYSFELSGDPCKPAEAQKVTISENRIRIEASNLGPCDPAVRR